MTPELLAGLWLVLGATALSSLGNSPEGRGYSGDYSRGNSFVVSSHHLVSDAQPSPGSHGGYSSRSGGAYGGDRSQYQERFHPTTYEEDSHTGEIVLPPLSSDNTAGASDLQGSFLQSGSFGSDPVAQGSDSFGTQVDPSSSSSGQELQYYPQPLAPGLPGGYDYRPPSPAPYYYPPPTPPPNLYLPVPTKPPPPPPPQEAEYTYFFIGPKLWYIPIICSIYFALYVGALIVMSVSRHKVLFPQQLFNAANSVFTGRQDLDPLAARVTKGLAEAALKYLRHRRTARR